jgi:CubicO group peptidase (beta-lactamase class C family)
MPGWLFQKSRLMKHLPSIAALFLISAVLASCGDNGTGTNQKNQTNGILKITTRTKHAENQSVNYSIVSDIGGHEKINIGANETIYVKNLDVGSYRIKLKGIAPGCTVSGDNPRSVDVMIGRMATTNFVVVCKPGQTLPDTKPIPQLDQTIKGYMGEFSIPGLSLAVMNKGKLAYVRGYGYADMANDEKVTKKSLFRIASISKTITAVTILHLKQEGKLSINEKVFGTAGILGTTYGKRPYKQYVTDITINNLLHMAAGGWGNSGFDPMFSNSSLNGDQLLSWILNNRPLKYSPGTHWIYSNVGYFILGKVIEKVTGEPYGKYVKKNILKPIGITDMQIAGNYLSQKKPHEVVYYPQRDGLNPYSGSVTRLGAAGAWVATAADLVKFMVHIDGFPNPPDILNEESMYVLTTPTDINANSAAGLQISSSGNWWHTGHLAGTESVLIRDSNGFCWAMLLNSASPKDNFLSVFRDGFMFNFVNDPSTPWSNINLF